MQYPDQWTLTKNQVPADVPPLWTTWWWSPGRAFWGGFLCPSPLQRQPESREWVSKLWTCSTCRSQYNSPQHKHKKDRLNRQTFYQLPDTAYRPNMWQIRKARQTHLCAWEDQGCWAVCSWWGFGFCGWRQTTDFISNQLLSESNLNLITREQPTFCFEGILVTSHGCLRHNLILHECHVQHGISCYMLYTTFSQHSGRKRLCNSMLQFDKKTTLTLAMVSRKISVVKSLIFEIMHLETIMRSLTFSNLGLIQFITLWANSVLFQSNLHSLQASCGTWDGARGQAIAAHQNLQRWREALLWMEGKAKGDLTYSSSQQGRGIFLTLQNAKRGINVDWTNLLEYPPGGRRGRRHRHKINPLWRGGWGLFKVIVTLKRDGSSGRYTQRDQHRIRFRIIGLYIKHSLKLQ